MDYDVEMLKLYFKEKNYTKEQIETLLENNPFNKDYVEWEQQVKYNNKTLIQTIKKLNLIGNSPIQEITNHEDNCLSKFLSNQCEVKISNGNIRLSNKLILMKGFIPNQKVILRKAYSNNIPFIVGTCSKELEYYRKMKSFYEEISSEIKSSKIIETESHNQKVCLFIKK
ncbi:MAG: hypothetical protein E7157_01640 [Lactobacillales bacterium]|nr:hypothetical protein [Lactobacillales bacterium]